MTTFENHHDLPTLIWICNVICTIFLFDEIMLENGNLHTSDHRKMLVISKDMICVKSQKRILIPERFFVIVGWSTYTIDIK